MRSTFTYAVIGRNEAERLHVAVAQGIAARREHDRVVFVDSGSDDDSVARAAALGVDVVKGPAGKGAAITAALEECDTEYVCFVDGDLESSTQNIFAALRDELLHSGADMVVGRFTEPVRRWAVTPGIYLPLVGALFPDEHAAAGIDIPLSGLRGWRTGIAAGELPRGYGVETYLNIRAALDGRAIGNCELGEFVGPLRGFANLPGMAVEVAGAILDLAVAEGRVRAGARPEWDAWVASVVAVIERMPPPYADDTEHRANLTAAAARPLPTA